MSSVANATLAVKKAFAISVWAISDIVAEIVGWLDDVAPPI